jgi:hypothetical protein
MKARSALTDQAIEAAVSTPRAARRTPVKRAARGGRTSGQMPMTTAMRIAHQTTIASVARLSTPYEPPSNPTQKTRPARTSVKIM